MRSYYTVPGDTFVKISRKAYGTETDGPLIAKANPGVVEPIRGGLELVLPKKQLPEVRQNQPATNPNEAAILIDARRFRFWNSVRITRTLDTVDTVTFTGPFEPEAPGYRETFKPFSYKPVEILVGGDLLFSGTLVDINPVVTVAGRTFTASCYSVPGVLMDCTAPASAYPIEYEGVDLRVIAGDLVAPFGMAVEFEASPGAVFERVSLKPEQKIYDFLADLARQRNLVVSSTTGGALLFRQSKAPGAPVAILQQGVSPLLSVTPAFNPQAYYSHLTGLEPVAVGLDGAQYTVKNPHLSGVLRPFAFQLPDAVGAETEEACRAKAGRMFASMASYTAEVATWRDPAGKLWAPNTTIKIQAPGAMIYDSYEFLIRSVDFSSEKQTATLELALPGAFEGKLPERLPWD